MQINFLVYTVNRYLAVYMNTISYYLYVDKINCINGIKHFS